MTTTPDPAPARRSLILGIISLCVAVGLAIAFSAIKNHLDLSYGLPLDISIIYGVGIIDIGIAIIAIVQAMRYLTSAPSVRSITAVIGFICGLFGLMIAGGLILGTLVIFAFFRLLVPKL